MAFGTIIFIIVGSIAIAAALGMLLSRSAVHSALFLILNLACVAFFYQMLSAPFMAMVQITVYAGAIMVLFLFVIMLLGAEESGIEEGQLAFGWQVPVASVLAVVFLLTVAVALFNGTLPDPATLTEAETAVFGGPAQIGEALFIRYVLPFEMVAVLLLASMIGAVVLSRDVDFAMSRQERLRAAREVLMRAGVRGPLAYYREQEEDEGEAAAEEN